MSIQVLLIWIYLWGLDLYFLDLDKKQTCFVFLNRGRNESLIKSVCLKSGDPPSLDRDTW